MKLLQDQLIHMLTLTHSFDRGDKMLIKKKLIGIPVSPCPAVRKTNDPADFYCSCSGVELCSDYILSLDIYNYDKQLVLRVFCDGINWINYDPSSGAWNNSKLENALDNFYPHFYSSSEDAHFTASFLEESYSYYRDAASVFCNWQSHKLFTKRAEAADRAYDRMMERLSHYEDNDEIFRFIEPELPYYCFMSKSVNKQRSVHCTRCGEDFYIDTSSFRHRQRALCGCCSGEVIYFKTQYAHTLCDKVKVCDIQIHDGAALYRWSLVERYYFLSGDLPSADYVLDAKFFTATDISAHPRRLWSYKVKTLYGEDFILKSKYETPPRSDEYILFYKNLSSAVPSAEYLEKYFREKPVRYDPLVIAFNNNRIGQIEYLLKLGLYSLASSVLYLDPEARRFSDLFGVSKQYLPLMRKYNISYFRLRWLQALDIHVDEELFRKISNLDITFDLFHELLVTYGYNKFSKRKLINYISKFEAAHDRLSFYATFKDFYQMLIFDLGCTFTDADFFPKDLLEAHDRLAERVYAIRREKENAEFSKAVPELYKTLPCTFERDNYAIVLPSSPDDFIKEGQALSICVGSSTYINKHMAGYSLICFIRKIPDLTKSYVCCEISLDSYTVVQVHGYKNDSESPLPKDVRKFADAYAAAIKKYRSNLKENKKNGKQRINAKSSAA